MEEDEHNAPGRKGSGDDTTRTATADSVAEQGIAMEKIENIVTDRG